jgi:hypothetical protein
MALRCPFCAMAHLPSESCGKDTEAGVARAFARSPVPEAKPAAFKEAAVTGEAFVKGGRLLKPEEVLALAPAPDKPPGFDRAAYQRAYRARRKGAP